MVSLYSRFQGLGFRVYGLIRVQGLEFRVGTCNSNELHLHGLCLLFEG